MLNFIDRSLCGVPGKLGNAVSQTVGYLNKNRKVILGGIGAVGVVCVAYIVSRYMPNPSTTGSSLREFEPFRPDNVCLPQEIDLFMQTCNRVSVDFLYQGAYSLAENSSLAQRLLLGYSSVGVIENIAQAIDHPTPSTVVNYADTSFVTKSLSFTSEKTIDESASSRFAWSSIKELRNCFRNIEKVEKTLLVCKHDMPSYRNKTLSMLSLKRGDVESNLKLANKILLETEKLIAFTTTNLARSREWIEQRTGKQAVGDFSKSTSEIPQRMSVCLNEARKFSSEGRCMGENPRLEMRSSTACRTFIGREIGEYPYRSESTFARSKILVDIAKRNSLGNCDEMSQAAIFKAMEMGIWNIPIERVSLKYGDHAVVVLDREVGSDRENYKTWGSSAVIIDVWARIVFKIGDIKTHLQNYQGIDDESGKPILKPYEDELLLQWGNIYSVEDIREIFNEYQKSQYKLNELQTQLIDMIIYQLEEFHRTNILEIKIEIATDLYELCSKFQNSFSRMFNLYDDFFDFRLARISSLKSQVTHFIELTH